MCSPIFTIIKYTLLTVSRTVSLFLLALGDILRMIIQAIHGYATVLIQCLYLCPMYCARCCGCHYLRQCCPPYNECYYCNNPSTFCWDLLIIFIIILVVVLYCTYWIEDSLAKLGIKVPVDIFNKAERLNRSTNDNIVKLSNVMNYFHIKSEDKKEPVKRSVVTHRYDYDVAAKDNAPLNKQSESETNHEFNFLLEMIDNQTNYLENVEHTDIDKKLAVVSQEQVESDVIESGILHKIVEKLDLYEKLKAITLEEEKLEININNKTEYTRSSSHTENRNDKIASLTSAIPSYIQYEDINVNGKKNKKSTFVEKYINTNL